MSAASNKKEPGFEKSLERLEQIVSDMEGGDLSLDEMMKHFEEGSNLVKSCSTKLNEVEKKIEKLVQKGGQLTTEPFEQGSSDAEA